MLCVISFLICCISATSYCVQRPERDLGASQVIRRSRCDVVTFCCLLSKSRMLAGDWRLAFFYSIIINVLYSVTYSLNVKPHGSIACYVLVTCMQLSENDSCEIA